MHKLGSYMYTRGQYVCTWNTHTLNMSENNQSKCTPNSYTYGLVHTRTAGTHTPEQDHTVQVYVCVCVYWHAHTHTDTEIMVKSQKRTYTPGVQGKSTHTDSGVYMVRQLYIIFKNNCTVVYSTGVQVGMF